jgi:hypothetical protein
MDNLSNLRDAVFAKQKSLAKIYSKSGKLNLSDYAALWPVGSLSERAGVFLSRLEESLKRSYPAELTEPVLAQIKSAPLVSTIDHHGILNHPFFLNSNLIYSQRPNLDYLICFSTASVSLNNSSWPGCLLVTDRGGHLRRFSFFPDRIKTRAVLSAKALGLKDVERVKSQITAADFLEESNKQKILEIVESIFQSENFYKLESFSRQAAYASTALWTKVFPSAPKLLYLPLEEIVSSVVAAEIAPRKNHILHKLFFTTGGWDIIERYFHGSLGAFGSGHKGSFLFWGVDSKGRRMHLARRGKQLIDGDVVISADAEHMTGLLQSGKIYPTSLVCFLVLLYYGITCLGGFNQVNWLTDIKEKFVDILKELSERELADSILGLPTENFAEGLLAFGINPEGQIYKPSLLDLLLRKDAGLFNRYRQLASLITVGESIDIQLPEIYKVIVPAEQRNPELLDVTESATLSSGSIADKIKSVF